MSRRRRSISRSREAWVNLEARVLGQQAGWKGPCTQADREESRGQTGAAIRATACAARGDPGVLRDGGARGLACPLVSSLDLSGRELDVVLVGQMSEQTFARSAGGTLGRGIGLKVPARSSASPPRAVQGKR